MQDVLTNGGVISWILFVIAAIALGVFLERLFALSKEKKKLMILHQELKPLIQKGNFDEALDKTAETDTVCAKILFGVLNKDSDKKSLLKEVLEETAAVEIPHIWKNMNLLSLIVTVSPLLGLLGTVVGMLTSFQEIELLAKTAGSGYGPSVIAGGIKGALVTTILGLSVSIPASFGVNFLSSKIEQITILLEKSAYEIIDEMSGVKKVRQS